MIAAISVFFGILNIIFNPENRNIILISKELCHSVDIINKRTGHPDSGYVI